VRAGAASAHQLTCSPTRRKRSAGSPSKPALNPGLAQHLARDDQLLDLRGALVDAEQAHVAVEALDRVVRDVAGAAVDLHRAVGDPADHLGGEVLAHRRLLRDARPLIAPARGRERQRLGGRALGLAVGEHRLDQLELGDRLAELAAPLGIGQAVPDQAARDADADPRHVQPPAVEHLHRGLEALALDAADQRIARHHDVLEDHVADVRPLLPHLALGFP
jgi:hypothetical protein